MDREGAETGHLHWKQAALLKGQTVSHGLRRRHHDSLAVQMLPNVLQAQNGQNLHQLRPQARVCSLSLAEIDKRLHLSENRNGTR